MRTLIATLTAGIAATAIAYATPAHASQSAGAPVLDMDAVHRAYFQIPAGAPQQSLQWFEQEVNRYNHGDDFISIAAQRAYIDGQPSTVISGYVDRDGIAGLNPASDQVMFRFVQTAPVRNYTLPYEFVDGSGLVYYRGTRALPRSAYFRAYYFGGVSSPFINYYTPSVRLGFLRSWRASYRLTPVYRTWYGRYSIYRPTYVQRIGVLRRTYGTSIGLPRARFSIGYNRPIVRTTIRTTSTRTVYRTPARAAVRTTVYRAPARTAIQTSTRTSFRAAPARVTTRTTVTRTTTSRRF